MPRSSPFKKCVREQKQEYARLSHGNQKLAAEKAKGGASIEQ
jgi:hypothetical protein